MHPLKSQHKLLRQSMYMHWWIYSHVVTFYNTLMSTLDIENMLVLYDHQLV